MLPPRNTIRGVSLDFHRQVGRCRLNAPLQSRPVRGRSWSTTAMQRPLMIQFKSTCLVTISRLCAPGLRLVITLKNSARHEADPAAVLREH